jgi:hypothetical protein
MRILHFKITNRQICEQKSAAAAFSAVPANGLGLEIDEVAQAIGS